ncbi:unnamed protein product [Amaranthus hypochondriacus]
MDSLSSSFLSSIPQTKVPNIVNIHSSSNPRVHISAVRIEDKPQAAISTSPRTTTPSRSPTSPNTKDRQPPLPPPPTTDTQKTIPTSLKPVTVRSYKTQPSPPKISFPSTFLNTIDDIINKFIDPPTRPSVDPRFVLTENFAPVEELPPTECEIEEGVLPSCLDGAYIRNGPNPQFLPRGPYHLFDGDGMLHSIRISNGKAILCSRYVKTYKYTIEKEAGHSVIPNVFSGFNGLIGSAARGTMTAARFIAGQFNPSNGIGLANTSLAFFGNKLYALGESDLPYEVKLTPNGDIQTVGRNDFEGKLFMSMTAHPKIDPDTGEAFAFRYGPVPPFLTYFRFNSNGIKQADVPIFSMSSPSFLHDFAITKKYAIFPEIQIGMDPAEMILRGGSPVGLNPAKISRIGVIPRYANDEKDMKWFVVPGFNIIHAINAWDEVDEDGNESIVLVAPNMISAEHTLERTHLVHALVEKIRIHLNTGVVTRQPLSARNLDFAVINPNYVGKKNNYVYAAVGDPMPKITGVVKMDVTVAQDRRECVVASRMFGPGCYGGEPFFVATHPDDPNAEEDEGYLVSYVHNENTGESRFLVMDAKSPNLDVVASVKLPQRVPYGFHGLFVRNKDLSGL